MNRSHNFNALAVDAGGTQCRLALVNNYGYETVVCGSANASSDFDCTVLSILSGLELLAKHLSVPINVVCNTPAYLGVAGALDSTIAKRLRGALPFDSMKIEDDRPSALCGAYGENDGIIAHCGTGSFFAVQESGAQRFAGGWGHKLDDVASAHWVGMRALRETLYVYDELVEPSEMTHELLKEYQCAASIVGFASEASTSEIAQLAKRVTHYARAEDVNAIRILKQGANLISEKLTQLGWSQGKSICLTGGISGHYKRYLSSSMQKDIVAAKGEPIDGAVLLACQFAEELNA